MQVENWIHLESKLAAEGLKKRTAQRLRAHGGQVGDGDVEHGAAAALAPAGEPVGRPGVGRQHGGGEAGVGVQLEAELHDGAVTAVPAGVPAAQHEAAVGQAGMVAGHLLRGYKVHGGVVVGEVIGHGGDFPRDAPGVRALLGHHEAFTGVLLPGGQLRIGAGAHRFQRGGHGDGVLPGVRHAGDAAHRVGVPLADPLAPEGVVVPVGQHAGPQGAHEGEQARIPAHRDDGHLAALPGGGVHVGKVPGDFRVGVEAVDEVEAPCVPRTQYGQVGGAAAAEDEYVDFLIHVLQGRDGVGARAAVAELQPGGVAAGEDPRQLHVRVLPDRALHAPPKVPIAGDPNSDFVHNKAPFTVRRIPCTAQYIPRYVR